MPDEPFLLVSLEEDKAKALAQVLSNDTARKILDYLSRNDLKSETEISKELKIPLSTVHYNLDLLSKSDLVSTDNFSYSEKGKQIVHYTLSNKYVIIAPKKTEALMQKLRQFLPVMFIATAASVLIKYFWPFAGKTAAEPLLRTMAEPFAEPLAEDSMIMIATEASDMAAGGLQTQEFAVWFLFGSVFALLVYFVWAEVILKKIKK
jgi:DNA-binding transcriptional ArsR family regulator